LVTWSDIITLNTLYIQYSVLVWKRTDSSKESNKMNVESKCKPICRVTVIVFNAIFNNISVSLCDQFY
jgi:hypothetical protein